MEDNPIYNSIYLTFKYRSWGIDINNSPFSCGDVVTSNSSQYYDTKS